MQLASFKLQPGDEARGLIKVHGSATYTYIPMNIDQAPKPSLEADIQLLKGPVTANPPKVFDAKQLKAALEPYVTGNKCNQNVCPHVHRYIMPSEAANL